MKGKAVHKVEGGKLLKITVEFDDVIDDVKITGDFFLHPEESIKDLEKNLFGIMSDADEKTITSILNDVIEEKNIDVNDSFSPFLGRYSSHFLFYFL